MDSQVAIDPVECPKWAAKKSTKKKKKPRTQANVQTSAQEIESESENLSGRLTPPLINLKEVDSDNSIQHINTSKSEPTKIGKSSHKKIIGRNKKLFKSHKTLQNIEEEDEMSKLFEFFASYT